MPIDFEGAARRLGLISQATPPSDVPAGCRLVDESDLRILLLERVTLLEANRLQADVLDPPAAPELTEVASLDAETDATTAAVVAMTGESVPVNLQGLVARWRGGELRLVRLPGVPWTAGEIGDALAPILRGREATSKAIASIASRGLHDPESLSTEDIQQVCASALTQVEKK